MNKSKNSASVSPTKSPETPKTHVQALWKPIHDADMNQKEEVWWRLASDIFRGIVNEDYVRALSPLPSSESDSASRFLIIQAAQMFCNVRTIRLLVEKNMAEIPSETDIPLLIHFSLVGHTSQQRIGRESCTDDYEKKEDSPRLRTRSLSAPIISMNTKILDELDL